MNTLEALSPIHPDALEDWQSLCDAGSTAREQADHWRWYLGDLACRVVTLFPPRKVNLSVNHTLAEFAKDINVPKKSLYQYRQVAAFYPLSTRVEFETLTYTHYRDAMRLGTLDDAMAWLAQCSEQGYTTDESGYKLGEILGATTGSDETSPLFDKVVSIKTDGDNVTFPCDAVLVEGVRYRFVVYEVSSDENA
jgi:hypothetical protein